MNWTIPSLVLVLFFDVQSQLSSLNTQRIYSENQKFHVNITGKFYEGFVGDQRISLIKHETDTMWTQIVPRRFLIMPAVSNTGDVSIVHREIKIYDSNNILKGEFHLKGRESPYHEVDYLGTVHGFSIDGQKYFIFMFVGNKSGDVALWCLSDSAKIIWDVNLGNYAPSEIIFYKDLLIVHDNYRRGINYQNYCYVFDSVGNILWQYKAFSKRRSDWKIEVDKEQGILYSIEANAESRINLDSLFHAPD